MGVIRADDRYTDAVVYAPDARIYRDSDDDATRLGSRTEASFGSLA